MNRLLSGRSFLDAIAKHEASDLHKITHAALNSQFAHLGHGARAPQPLAPTQAAAQAAARGASEEVTAQAAARGANEVSDTFDSAGGGAVVSQLGSAGAVTDPFRGHVPQVRDWLDTWAEVTSFISSNKQATLCAKKMLGKLGRGRMTRRRMLRIMAAVARERLCGHVKACESATEALDDCKGWKIIRTRCDTPGPPYCSDGVLGVIKKTYCDAASGAEDHAERTLKCINALHRRVFVQHTQRERKTRRIRRRGETEVQNKTKTNKRQVELSTVCDEEALQSFRHKVRILAADGGSGERRAVFLATKKYFPRASVVIRDPAHALRIATQKPLQLEGLYGHVYEEIINKRHALIPDISNSPKWKELLVGIQSNVLRLPGLSLAGCLSVVLKHLSFAKQRMDSCADPLAKFCLMILPMCLLLSVISCDERCEWQQRERAEAMLRLMQPKFLHAAGVSADWGLICMQFLRLFDRAGHDVANSKDELEDFCATVRACFIEGRVFMKSPSVPASGGAQKTPAMFITERVRRQIERPAIFRCGAQQAVVWGPVSKGDLQEVAQRTRNAAEVMLGRVTAELQGIRQHFSCFAARRLAQALARSNRTSERDVEQLIESLRALSKVFVLDDRVLVIEYKDVLPLVNQLWQAALLGDEATRVWYGFDNRRLWVKLLDEQFTASAFPCRVAKFTELPKLIRIWMSWLDGESQVERDLAALREFCDNFTRGGEDLLDDLVVLKFSGPQDPQEVAKKADCSAGSFLSPTAFTIRCVELWRANYGQRYGLDLSQRKRRIPKPKRTNSFAEARRGVLRAAERARAASVQKSRINPSEMTSYGVPAGVFQTETMKGGPMWNKALEQFTKHTLRQRARNLLSLAGREGLPKHKPRPGYTGKPKFKPRPGYTGKHSAESLSRVKRLAYLTEVDEAAGGAVAVGLQESRGLHRCREADMIIVDSLDRFHATGAELALVIDVLYLVARGLPLTTQACAARVSGRVQSLTPAEVMEHSPMKTFKTEFLLEASFRRSHREVKRAIRACCALPDSKWVLVEKFAPSRPGKGGKNSKPASGGAPRRRATHQRQVLVSSLGTLWEWLQATRRIKNTKHAALWWRADTPIRV